MSISNLINLRCLAFILLSCAFGHQAKADDNISVSQNWCAGGYFETVVEGIGPTLPGPNDSCFSLTSSTLSSPDPISYSGSSSKPSGNSVDFILRSILKNHQITFRDLKMPQAKEYIVKSGSCLNVAIFVVEDIKRSQFPVLYAGNQGTAVTQCHFDKSIKLQGSSDVELSGVYERSPGVSVEQFISTQFGH